MNGSVPPKCHGPWLDSSFSVQLISTRVGLLFSTPFIRLLLNFSLCSSSVHQVFKSSVLLVIVALSVKRRMRAVMAQSSDPSLTQTWLV